MLHIDLLGKGSNLGIIPSFTVQLQDVSANKGCMVSSWAHSDNWLYCIEMPIKITKLIIDSIIVTENFLHLNLLSEQKQIGWSF